MLQLQIIAGAKALPIYDLPAALGAQAAAKEVADQIEALMAFLDDLGGDPDLEEGNDLEEDNSDREGGSWPEDQLTYGTMNAYGDDEQEDDLPDVRQRHRRFIQRTRCRQSTVAGATLYRLNSGANNRGWVRM
ncbi:hypothetical protein [Sphingomonas kyungheensis]|uniref:Uncharacterized protein n=1 Tax=Sphingomonas kyungheensis TaxID=1069987 RepID=A0ABU8H411_9SPHN